VGVFRVKYHDLHAGGYTLKARFCANGQAVDAPPGGWESTANVASCTQILTVIALAVQLDLDLAQIDVKSAFTQVKLRDDQRIWIKPLPGLKDSKGRVLRLLHHLYGHPLANAEFQDRWVELMLKFGFTIVDSAKTVFSYQKDGERMMVATVVDDSIVAYSSSAIYEKFTQFLRDHLPITEGPLDTICGMKVTRNSDGSISVDQSEYITKKAEAFKCDKKQGKVFRSPMDTKFILDPRPEVADKAMVKYARELMGSLIYATLTRHDCKYACSKLASAASNPTRRDIVAMERILQYMYASRETPLTFRKGPWIGPDKNEHGPLEMATFVDASFAQEIGRKSQTGFAIMMSGAAIFSKSGKQTQVTDSTPYSETIALHESVNWVLMFRNQLRKLGVPIERPPPIYEDNQATVVYSNKGPGTRSLHWDVKLEYVHEQHAVLKNIAVTKIDTEIQIADILTKALPIEQHLYLSSLLLGGPVLFT
jgi:hypothetical protein